MISEEDKKELTRKVVIVQCEDWEGLYIDGELKEENHELSAHDIVSAFTKDYGSIFLDSKTMDSVGCSFPSTLAELKKLLQVQL